MLMYDFQPRAPVDVMIHRDTLESTRNFTQDMKPNVPYLQTERKDSSRSCVILC